MEPMSLTRKGMEGEAVREEAKTRENYHWDVGRRQGGTKARNVWRNRKTWESEKCTLNKTRQ